MLEDFRGHDPNPTVHERAWMDANPYPVMVRVAVMAAIALLVAMSLANDDTRDDLSRDSPSPESVVARTAG